MGGLFEEGIAMVDFLSNMVLDVWNRGGISTMRSSQASTAAQQNTSGELEAILEGRMKHGKRNQWESVSAVNLRLAVSWFIFQSDCFSSTVSESQAVFYITVFSIITIIIKVIINTTILTTTMILPC